MQQQLDRLNYVKSIYNFIGTSKGIFSNQKHFIAIFNDRIAISTKLHSTSPKYLIPLTLSSQILWNFDKQNQLCSFTISFDHQQKLICAEPEHLYTMKKLIKQKIIQFRIVDFYDPILVIGKGSSAKVLLIEDKITKQKFAAKAINKNYLEKIENGKEAFENEVRILSGICDLQNEQKEYFLELKEIFEGDQTLYLVTDLLEGKSLQEELDFLRVTKYFNNRYQSGLKIDL